ncbi:MAG: RNA polymerase sigma factor [Acidimicrobiia bacterium]|nr:RNA polymerase sigma factor [Acidimicrobiia bacterium]
MTGDLTEILRIEGGQVLATLIRLTRSFDLAEDALQDATVVALQRWPLDGVPANPAGWLTTVARNKALDRIRRESVRTSKESEAMRLLGDPPVADGDDRLRLLFTCCHPALSLEARVALALRTIGGVSTVDIARMFLVAEATMGQRISRAKKKIAGAHIPYRIPSEKELPGRLDAVLATIYLIFTAAHHAPSGELDSHLDAGDEAIRLARLLVALMPDEPEARGLLALLVTTHARRVTRLDSAGDVVLLADQDRSMWDRGAIIDASSIVDSVMQRGPVGPYQIQAAIASLHSEAERYDQTNWLRIAQLYRLLEGIQPGPVVRVNRAVAEAQVSGPAAGLDLLTDIAGSDGWYLFWSTKADFLRRLGRWDEAVVTYQRALECSMNDTDRRFLESRLAGVTHRSTGTGGR